MELTTNKYEKWEAKDLNTAEIAGGNVLAYIQSFPQYKDVFESILISHEIRNVQPESWYSVKAFVNSLDELYSYASDSLFFDMGKNLVKILGFHMQELSFKEVFIRIEEEHQRQHRGGNMGYNKVTLFDENDKKATIETNSPYPSEFMRGIFSAFLNAYKPEGSKEVILIAQDSKNIGSSSEESVFFDISW